MIVDPAPIWEPVQLQAPDSGRQGMIFATKNLLLLDDIAATPALEDGVGPVLIGQPAVYTDGVDTWYVFAHPFAEIDGRWIEAYCSGENPGILMLEAIPAEWTQSVVEV